jgi:hypothetical protein
MRIPLKSLVRSVLPVSSRKQESSVAYTGLSGHLNYSDRNISEKSFQTYTMRVELFHTTWNSRRPSAEDQLTAYSPLQLPLKPASTGESGPDRSTGVWRNESDIHLLKEFIHMDSDGWKVWGMSTLDAMRSPY